LASFPAADVSPRVAVYGSLHKHLPAYKPVSALEVFLYGPQETDPHLLRHPQGMTVVGERLLICDQGVPDVVALNLSTGKSESWCDPDHRPRCPVGIAADAGGRVYVSDTTIRAVLVYGPDGKFVEQLEGEAGTTGNFRPCGLLVADGVLYVGNLAARKVDRFDLASGRWLSPFSPPEGAGPLIAPTGLGLTPDGTILVADAVAGVVHRVSSDGRWAEPLGSRGRGPGSFVRPKQVCCTYAGLILVSDAGRQSVLVFDAEGRYLAEVLGQPDGWGGWTLPMGLVSLPDGAVRALAAEAPGGGRLTGRDCVIVSDSLGKPSLTVLGILDNRGAEVADAR
jgi:sugar lactone lactonase YvrE